MIKNYLKTIKKIFTLSAQEKTYKIYKKKLKNSKFNNVKFLIFFNKKTKTLDESILNDLCIEYEDVSKKDLFFDKTKTKQAPQLIDDDEDEEEDSEFLEIKKNYKRIEKLAYKKEHNERMIKSIEIILEQKYKMDNKIKFSFYQNENQAFFSFVDNDGFANTLTYSKFTELAFISRIMFLYYSNLIRIVEKEKFHVVIDSLQTSSFEDILKLTYLNPPHRVGLKQVNKKIKDLERQGNKVFFSKDLISEEEELKDFPFSNFLDIVKLLMLRKEDYKRGLLEIWCNFISHPYDNDFKFQDIINLIPLYSKVDLFTSKSYLNFDPSPGTDILKEYKVKLETAWKANKKFFSQSMIGYYKLELYDDELPSAKANFYNSKTKQIIMASLSVAVIKKGQALTLSEFKGTSVEKKEELLLMGIKILKEIEKDSFRNY